MARKSLKRRTWEVLEAANSGDRLSLIVDRFILTLILLNVLLVVLETVPSLYDRYERLFYYLEFASVAIFSIEYLLRLWSCTARDKPTSPVLGRLRFMVTPMALIDLVAILPSLLLLTSVDTRTLRILRFFRLFRLAKTGRYSPSVRLLGKVFIDKREELGVTMTLLLFLLVVTSTLMFFIENEAQPEAFSSIPATMWWAVATLTTVGYGDVAPITALGRFLGAIVAIIGIGLFALPTGILGAGFMEVFEKEREAETCPHCGKHLHGP